MSELQHDATSPDATENGVTGQIVESTAQPGYRRAVLTATAREALEPLYSKLIQATIKDHKELDRRRKLNFDAYDAQSDTDQMISIPVTKRDANQQIAWWLMTLFEPEHLMKTRALESGEIELVVTNEQGETLLQTVTTEEEADAFEELIHWYYTYRIGMKKTVRTFVTGMAIDGNRPPVLKVVHDAQTVKVGSPAIETDPANPRLITSFSASSPTFKQVRDGEPVRIECLPGDSFFAPMGWCDIQRAPFVFQLYEESTATMQEKWTSGVYDLTRPDDAPAKKEDWEEILALAEDLEEGKRGKLNDGRIASDPQKMHQLAELWFDHPFFEKPGVATWYRFCSVYHVKAKRFLNIYDNPLWMGKRPFREGIMQLRPHSFSGYSTVENAAPMQRLMSQLFHLQVQNMVMSNVKVFMVRRSTETYRFLTNPKNKLRPGLVIPYEEPDDIKTEPLGSAIGSMAAEIAFLNGEAEKMTVVTEHDRGQVQTHTSGAAVAAVESLGKMQAAETLDLIREALADITKMFVQVLIQFSPEGIVIPFRDPTKKALIDRVIHFPREMITDNFAFEVTASAADDTKQAQTEQALLLGKTVNEFNVSAMGIAGEAFLPGAPPPLVLFATKLLLGARNAAALLFKINKHDPRDYLPDEEMITDIYPQLQAIQQAAEAARAAQPQIKVSLSGKLTPEQEVAAAAMQGIQGAPPNGQLPAAGPGPTLPAGQGQPVSPQLVGAVPNDAGAPPVGAS